MNNLPPLAQEGFAGGSGPIVLGGREADPGNFSGGRITAGLWLNQTRTVGLEASYFVLESRARNESVSSSGTPQLIRPFNNVAP